MGDIRLNGRLVAMCMGTSAWCIIKATEHACDGLSSWHLSNKADSTLRNKNSDLVVITGGMTGWCVHATVQYTGGDDVGTRWNLL